VGIKGRSPPRSFLWSNAMANEDVPVRKEFVRNVTMDWRTLNTHIKNFTLEETIYALELENERAEPRKSFLSRLTSRYNGIREEEIRRELI